MIEQTVLIKRDLFIGGAGYEPGDVVDLAPLKLAPGKMKYLVDQGKVELVTSADSFVVPDTAQALIESAAVAGGAPEPDVRTDTILADAEAVLNSGEGETAPAVEHDPALIGAGIAPAPSKTKPAEIDENRVAELSALPKDELVEMAKAIGAAVRGSKAEIADRIAAAEAGVTS